MGRILITLQLLGLLSMLSGGYFLSQLGAWSLHHAATLVLITGSVG